MDEPGASFDGPASPGTDGVIGMTREKLEACTKKELAEMARDRGIAGWHAMRRDQLLAALTPARKPKTKPAPARPAAKKAPAPKPAAKLKVAAKPTPVKVAPAKQPTVSANGKASASKPATRPQPQKAAARDTSNGTAS